MTEWVVKMSPWSSNNHVCIIVGVYHGRLTLQKTDHVTTVSCSQTNLNMKITLWYTHHGLFRISGKMGRSSTFLTKDWTDVWFHEAEQTYYYKTWKWHDDFFSSSPLSLTRLEIGRIVTVGWQLFRYVHIITMLLEVNKSF